MDTFTTQNWSDNFRINFSILDIKVAEKKFSISYEKAKLSFQEPTVKEIFHNFIKKEVPFQGKSTSSSSKHKKLFPVSTY